MTDAERHALLHEDTSQHRLTCACPACCELATLHSQHLTRAPALGNSSSQVSLQELLDVRPRYSVGEDWNDD